MSRDVWEDLADSELRERLERRHGVDPGIAAALVRGRDNPSAAAVIERVWNP